MDIDEILRCLERDTGKFPREALQAAIERRDEIIPRLLEILEETIRNAEELAEQHGYMAPLYAMYLLAQFRETRAYPLVVQFARLAREITDALSGDFVTEDLCRVLAAVCGGDLDPIKQLAEDPQVNEYVRSAALRSLACLAACGRVPRDEVMAYYKSLFATLERDPSFAWTALVDCSLDLWPAEVVEEVQQAYQDGLVAGFFVNVRDLNAVLEAGKRRAFERLRINRRYALIGSAIEETERWACFEDRAKAKRYEPPPREELPYLLDADEDEEPEAISPDADEEAEQHEAPSASTPRSARLPGRNEPCPCGSGKKYKKCCGR